jgi:thiol-disulfide isomerase/thioredoxin
VTEQESRVAGQEPGRQTWSKVLLAVVAVLGVAGVAWLGVEEARRTERVPDGAAAPSFQMKRHEGGMVSLEELRGKVVMLDFWATWCPPCKAEMPALVKLAKEYEGRGLVFVAASRDDMPDAPTLVEDFVNRHLPELGHYVVYAPDEMATAFQVSVLPTLYFLDRQGRVVDSHRGILSEAELRRRIERALGP